MQRPPEVYADAAGQYRWRICARNGRIVASSGEAFASQRNARRAAARFIKAVLDAHGAA